MEADERVRPAALSGGWADVSLEPGPEHDGLRLDVFLSARLRRCARADARRLVEEGRVELRGRPAKASSRVAAGQKVLVRFPRRADPPASCSTLRVLHEDDWILAVEKPSGVLAQPTDRIKRNSIPEILRSQFPGGRLHTVHRLDKETSGVLLLAKGRTAARALTLAFERREISKEYLAIVRGRVGWDWKLVDAPLGPVPGPVRVRQGTRPDGHGALTELERVASADDRSLVRAFPKTGRLHQIRAHLAWLGHPVLGDKIYTGEGEAYLKASEGRLSPGDLEGLGAPRHMLHAARVSLSHPETGRRLSIECAVPPDFAARLPSCARISPANVL